MLIKAGFVELPAFERRRPEIWTDDEFFAFQEFLIFNPLAGDVIPNSGGLRKVRFTHRGQQKGKRSGTRVIYYLRREEFVFLLFGIYTKDEKDHLCVDELRGVRNAIYRIREEFP